MKLIEKIKDIKESVEIYLEYNDIWIWFPPYRKWKAEWEKQNIYDDFEKMMDSKMSAKRIKKEIKEIERNGNRLRKHNTRKHSSSR